MTYNNQPFQYIFFKDGVFKVNKKVSGTLKRIQDPLHVISVIGKYRTGKSYFMNRLFEVQSETDGGFVLGSTIKSETKGIWGWLRKIDGKQYLLIDTEGLYDPQTQGINFDNKIISFALLLSSVFVLNSTGTIDRASINQLEFVVALTKSLKAYASQKSKISDYKIFFPDFVWLVRDFFLEMKNGDGATLSDNQYLDEMLRVEPDDEDSLDTEVQQMTRTKRYIKEMFPQRRCFTLVQPVPDPQNLHRIHEMEYSELDDRFTKKMDRIVAFLHQNVKPKEMFGKVWSGRLFYEMTKLFVDHVNSEKFLSMDTSFASVVSRNNEKIEKEAICQYEEEMNGCIYGTADHTKKKIFTKLFRTRTMVEKETILEYLQEEEEGEGELSKKEEEEEEETSSSKNDRIGDGLPMNFEKELFPLHEKVLSRCRTFFKKNIYAEDAMPAEQLEERFVKKIILYDTDKVNLPYDQRIKSSLMIGGVFYNKYVKVNELKSEEKCKKMLKKMWKERIDDKFEVFTKSGDQGYKTFLSEKEKIRKGYLGMKKMGPKKQPVLKKFLEEKKNDEEKIKAMSTFILEKSQRIEELEGEIDLKMNEIEDLQKKVKSDQKRLKAERKKVEEEKLKMKEEMDRKQRELENEMEKKRLDLQEQMEKQKREAAARKKCGPCLIM